MPLVERATPADREAVERLIAAAIASEGGKPKPERVVELPLSKRLVSAIGRVEFHTVRVQDGLAVPAYKESGAITSMAHADGYIEIPANVDLIEKGERVRVTLF